MFSFKVLENSSPMVPWYSEVIQEKFPKIRIEKNENEVHIVVFYDQVLVGGVTLLTLPSFSDDSDVTKFWNINKARKVTRIMRLWASPMKGVSVIPHIFQALLSYTDQDSFLYGILSLPLGYAKNKSSYLGDDQGWLSPKCPLGSCHWDSEMNPSSEGNKLLITYLRLGAKVLGPVSGDPSSYSVRVVMGMNKNEILIPTEKVIYA